MEKQQIRVSIGLPVYNGEEYLSETLDSLLSQTLEDFELIISDNCSQDSTPKICSEYTSRDKRIRYYRQMENLGAIWNHNHVFTLARGKYFKWAAYDDICHPSFLSRCVEVLDEDPTTVWCHTQSSKIDHHGENLSSTVGKNCDPEHSSDAGHPRRYYRSGQPHKRFLGVLLGTNWCVDCYGLFRKNILDQTRMLLPCFGAEKVLIGEVSLLGRYQEIPETLFFQRIHSQSSINLPWSVKRRHLIDPQKQGRQHVAFTRLQLLGGHIGSVLYTNLRSGERVRCFVVILLYLLQVRKWKKVLTSTVTGAGLGE